MTFQGEGNYSFRAVSWIRGELEVNFSSSYYITTKEGFKIYRDNYVKYLQSLGHANVKITHASIDADYY